MVARLLFAISIAAAFLFLTPASASAHCHKPTAFQLAPSAVGHEVSSDKPCGESGRRGVVTGAGVLALGTAAYGFVAIARTRTSGATVFPSDALWPGRGNPHDVPDLRETDPRKKDPSPNKVEGLKDVFTTVRESIENGVLGGSSSARATATQWTARPTSSTAKSVSPFQPTFAAPSPELLAAVIGYGAIRGLAWLGPKVWSGIRSVWRCMR